MKNVVNIAMYQIIWFLCVLFGNTGALAGMVLVILHLILSDRKKDDLQMAGFLLILGVVVDGTLTTIDFFSFTEPGFPLPFWLIVIWLGLSTTPHHSLAWMKKRPMLSILFGAIGGPAAYWAGVRLGAATFHWEIVPSLVLLSIVWATLWTLVMYVSQYWDGRQARLPRT